MKLAFDIFTISVVSAGAFFFLAGTVGLLRFPDSLTRLHLALSFWACCHKQTDRSAR